MTAEAKGVKLTKTQATALRLAAQDPEWELHRWDGGFWTFAGCSAVAEPTWPHRHRVPAAYVTYGTLAALERKGLMIARAFNSFGEVRRYRTTDTGRQALSQECEGK
jgi:hypothetical protein